MLVPPDHLSLVVGRPSTIDLVCKLSPCSVDLIGKSQSGPVIRQRHSPSDNEDINSSIDGSHGSQAWGSLASLELVAKLHRLLRQFIDG